MHFSHGLPLALLPLILASPVPTPEIPTPQTAPGVNIINPTAQNIIPNKYIITYKQGTTDADIQAYQKDAANKLNGIPTQGLPLAGVGAPIAIDGYKALTVETSITGIAAIGNNKIVESVELDTMRSLGNPMIINSTAITKPMADYLVQQPYLIWSLGRISHRLKGYWNYIFDTTQCAGTRIYVIDTGILTTHQEFAGRAVWGANFITGSPNTDQNGHGTHTASTTSGNNVGVCKQSTVIAVKVLDSTGSGSTSGVIAGVQWAVNNAASLNKKPKSVISMSLGGSPSTAMDAAVTAAFNAGIFVAVAAGNDGIDASNKSPARAPAVTTVGATDISDVRPMWSNFGSLVDVHAPGVNVLGAWIGSGNNWYNTISGTSMATPAVAGLAAYFIAKEGLATPAAVTNRIIGASTANVIKNPNGVSYGPYNRLAYNADGY